MAGIVVKPRARILHGHDWVFSGEVLKVFGDPAAGDVRGSFEQASIIQGAQRLQVTAVQLQQLVGNGAFEIV
jgi:hypothetical protein